MPGLNNLFRLARNTTIAAVLGYGGSAGAAELSVCVDKSSPTAEMDAALARAVAKQEGKAVKIHYFDGDDDDGFDGFAKLAHQCTLVMGFPVAADEPVTPEGLLATAPYGHTGFVLVTPAGSSATTLDQLPKGATVAVGYQTTPNLYFPKYPSLHADVHVKESDALASLDAHKVQAAMLWRPTVASYSAIHHARFDLHDLDSTTARYDFVALYDKSNAAAAQDFDKAVVTLAHSGALTKVTSPYLDQDAAKSEPKGQKLAEATPAKEAAPAAAKPAPAADAAGASAPPALFTTAQAEGGKQKYADNCAICHGPTLAGRAGPALKGPTFASPTAGFTVSDIFIILSQNMPATNPGSLEPDEYVQIMAFLLQQNGFPAGDKPLTFDDANKSKVPLIYHGN